MTPNLDRIADAIVSSGNKAILKAYDLGRREALETVTIHETLGMHWIREPDGTVRHPRDIDEWIEWMAESKRTAIGNPPTAGKRQIRDTRFGDERISTVFLGIDHGDGSGLPVLWETMVFGGPLNEECERYTSEADAIAGHEAMVARVKAEPAVPLAAAKLTERGHEGEWVH